VQKIRNSVMFGIVSRKGVKNNNIFSGVK
jgi:hypothetical protein